MAEYRFVIDQSTSGTKLILFDTESDIKMIQRMDKPHTQLYPQKGWVEHDPLEIVGNVKFLIEEMLDARKLKPSQITTLSITNQRESVVIWDKVTGEPYTNILVWQCNRGIYICQQLNETGFGPVVKEKTGLNIDPYFSGSKLKWFFDQTQLSQDQLDNLAIGTIDSWLLWHLSEEKNHVTEMSNASRTLLFNIHTLEWDQELCRIFNVPMGALPEVKNSVDDFGTYQGIPIASIVADSQSALIGHACETVGEIKATLGTGSSLLMNVDSDEISENKSILTTIVHKEKGNIVYALEGAIRSYGDILNWMQDELNLFDNVERASEEAFQLAGNDSVYFVPALEGLGAPFWSPDATGSFKGITRNTNRTHLIRAGFESMAYQTRSVLDTFELDGFKIDELKVDGGIAKNKLFTQFLADVTNKKILVGDMEEASAFGTVCVILKPTKDKMGQYREYVPTENYDFQFAQWLSYVNKTLVNGYG